MNTRVGRCLSASKSGQSFALWKAWHLQWRGSALDAAAIKRPRRDVSPTDGRPQVLCAASRQASKAMAFMYYMRIVQSVRRVDRQLRVAARLSGSKGTGTYAKRRAS